MLSQSLAMSTMGLGIRRLKMRNGNNIDLSLSVMCVVAKPGETLSCEEIAYVCGCSGTYIRYIYTNAMRKFTRDGRQLLEFME